MGRSREVGHCPFFRSPSLPPSQGGSLPCAVTSYLFLFLPDFQKEIQMSLHLLCKTPFPSQVTWQPPLPRLPRGGAWAGGSAPACILFLETLATVFLSDNDSSPNRKVPGMNAGAWGGLLRPLMKCETVCRRRRRTLLTGPELAASAIGDLFRSEAIISY